MRVLYTCFNGKCNSSKILLDKINGNNKLYLKNSFITSVSSLMNELSKNSYDLVVSFGQAPLPVDTLKIELVGNREFKYKTKYDYTNIKSKLELYGYKVLISNNAGNYLCNNLYYYGLKYINDNRLNCNMIFIHIPKINNISDINNIAEIFSE